MKQHWLWLAISLLLSVALVPRPVAADSSVVVLGVRSLDGDDEQAREVSSALRQAARKVEGFQVSDRDVSLAQMSLAHGCDEPDARCMADIASTLKVDRLIYGTMTRAGGETQIALFSFDSISGQVDASVEQRVAADKLQGALLAGTAQQLVERLAGKGAVGTLRVLGDTPGAEVSIDGSPAGELSPRGELVLENVAAGKHTVSVHDPANERVRDVPVMVGENATATLRVVLRPPTTPLVEEPEPAYEASAEPVQQEPSSLRRIIGWTSVGLAVGLAGATVYSWVRIGNINDDPTLLLYRDEFPPTTADVCVAADQGRLSGDPSKAALEASANSLCHEADTLEVLQYVFLGSALAFGGVGTYLLLTDAKRSQRVSLTPSFGHGQAFMRAAVRF